MDKQSNNGWRAPEYSQIALTKEILRQFSVPQGGAINHSSFYVDNYAALDWCSISRRANYLSTFENLSMDWPDWMAHVIFHHLKRTNFSRENLDVIGLGVGDGHKETLLCGGLARNPNFKKLRCFLLDISSPLVNEAHANFTDAFAENPNVTSSWVLGDFNNLPRYKELFFDPSDENTLRIGTLFGNTLPNIRHEVSFIEQSLRAFKSGDMLVIGVSLGYAPPTKPDLIKQLDPSFNSPDGLEWLLGVLKRNRPDAKKVSFDFEVKAGISTIPNSYTIEILATVDGSATFSMFQKHRYQADDLIMTFMKLGWKPLEGRYYGHQKRQLVYIFAKK